MSEVQIWLCVGWCFASLFAGLFACQSYNVSTYAKTARNMRKDAEYWQGDRDAYQRLYREATKELDALRTKLKAKERQEPHQQDSMPAPRRMEGRG